IFHWQPNAGTTINSQILIEVANCAESINGVKEGRWRNTFTFYKPILKEQANALEFPQNFLGVSLQEQPDKFYMAISRNDWLWKQTIMENLQSYRMKLAVNCEMEYLPISSWETSHLIMSEFFEIWKETLGKRSLPGHFVHVEPKFSKFGLSDQYTSQHTVVQDAIMAATSQSSGSNISIITSN
uniref:Mediator of RNA polymerase II transcription subunit 20 n=1 Tax=Solanum tuberosum TaxID=4113 RepID=M1DKN1_SOLTU